MKEEKIEDIELYFNSNSHKNDIDEERVTDLKYKINDFVAEHLKRINPSLIKVFLTDDYSPYVPISLDDTILKITGFASKDCFASRYGNNAVELFKDGTYFLELSKKIGASLTCVNLIFDDKDIISKLTNNKSNNDYLLINQDGKYVGFLLCYQN